MWLPWAAVAMGLHLHFSWIDSRPAVDLGHTWSGVIRAVESLRHGGGWLRHVDGPWQALVALVLWAWPSSFTFAVLDGLLFVPLIVGLAWAGGAAGGRIGAHVAAAVPVAVPLFPVAARTHWIHHPEAAFAALALGIAATAPVGLGGGAALAATLAVLAPVRPSATVWALVPVAVWVARAGRDRRALGPLVVPALVAAALVGPGLAGYLALRVGNRQATAAAVGNWLPLLPIQTGWLGGLVLVGLGALGLRAWRQPVVAAGLAWIAGGLAVLALSGAGPDNVPSLFLGLAVLAAAGAATVPRAAPVAAIVLLGPLTQLVPPLGALGPVTGWPTDDVALNWLVPRADGVTAEALVAPLSGRIRVLSRRGWVHPSWEDDGALGRFLAGIGDGVEVIPAPMWRGQPIDIVVDTACAGPTPDPRARFPGVDERFDEIERRRVAYAEVRGNGCVWTFHR